MSRDEKLVSSSRDILMIQSYTSRMKVTGRPVKILPRHSQQQQQQQYHDPRYYVWWMSSRLVLLVLVPLRSSVDVAPFALCVMKKMGSSSVIIASSAKCAVSFTFVCNSGGAFRHFLWDYFPNQLGNKADVQKTSYTLIETRLSLALDKYFSNVDEIKTIFT